MRSLKKQDKGGVRTPQDLERKYSFENMRKDIEKLKEEPVYEFLILKSISNKKQYKITVDDTGTLKAEEM